MALLKKLATGKCVQANTYTDDNGCTGMQCFVKNDAGEYVPVIYLESIENAPEGGTVNRAEINVEKLREEGFNIFLNMGKFSFGGTERQVLIRRYENAIREYFGYEGDSQGKLVRNYIMSEYEKILVEETGLSEENVKAIYNRIYAETYFGGKAAV